MSKWKPAGTGVWVSDYLIRGNVLHTSAVDMGDGSLLVISPGTDVPDATFEALDALGEVKALVSPGAFHNMGLPLWSARYPHAGLFGPVSAVAHIARQWPTLRPLKPLDALRPLLSGEFDLGELAGCKHPDMFLALTRGGETTWFANELLTNNATYPPSFVFRQLFKLTGDHPGLNVNRLASMLTGADRRAVRAYLDGKLRTVPPTRLVPTHGDVVEDPALGTRLGEILARRF